MRGIGRTPTDWLDLPPITRGIGRTPTDWSDFPWAYWTNIPFTPPVNPTNLQTVEGGGDKLRIGTIHTSSFRWIKFQFGQKMYLICVCEKSCDKLFCFDLVVSTPKPPRPTSGWLSTFVYVLIILIIYILISHFSVSAQLRMDFILTFCRRYTLMLHFTDIPIIIVGVQFIKEIVSGSTLLNWKEKYLYNSINIMVS